MASIIVESKFGNILLLLLAELTYPVIVRAKEEIGS